MRRWRWQVRPSRRAWKKAGWPRREVAALDALVERGKEAHEAKHPEIEVGDGHPDGAGFEVLEDGPGEAEDGVVGLAVGEEFVEHFGDVGEGDTAGVIDGAGERGQEHVAGVEAGEFAAFAILPEGADAGGGFEGSAEALLRALGGLGDAFHLAFGAGEESDEQVGLAKRIGAQDDRLGLLEGHGKDCRAGFRVSRVEGAKAKGNSTEVRQIASHLNRAKSCAAKVGHPYVTRQC